MRVQIVDPAAYTPPYDHALSGALARAGAEVELITARFPVWRRCPWRRATRCVSSSTGAASRAGDRAAGAAACCAPPSTSRTCAATAESPRRPIIVHYQWLPIPALDRRLLPPKRPRVYTMHWRLPEAGCRIGRSLTKLLAEMDAVVVHSEHGARRAARPSSACRPSELRVIPHGAFDYLTRQAGRGAPARGAAAVEGPVILAFGLIRPYKGTDVLLDAFSRVEGGELWIVGVAADADGRAACARRIACRAGFVSSIDSSRTTGDPGLHAARRPRRPAVPEHRAIRRPLHRARLRATARPELGGRVHGDRRARCGPPRPTRRIPTRWPRRSRS